MSVKSKRFDNYIPLFGRADDKRVTLLLGELEDHAKEEKNKAGRKNYEAVDIKLTKVTPGLQNQFFINKDAALADTDVHPDWKNFMLQLAVRLGGKTVNDAKTISNLKALKGASTDNGSVRQFVVLLLSTIAAFTSTAGDKDFVANNSLLDTATGIKFKAAHEIITALTDDKIIDAGSDDNMLVNGLVGAGNDLTPGGKTAGNMKTKYEEKANARLKAEFAIYQATTRYTTFIATGAVTGATDKNAFIAVLKDFIASLDTVKEFGYNYDKYFKALLVDASEQKIVVNASKFFDDAIVDQGKYWRKADGSLWTADAKGDEVQVDSRSEAFKKLTVGDKCLSSGLKNGTDGKADADQPTCANYLRECLAGGDVTKCVDYMKNENYWTAAQAEIDAMLPPIALKTLQSFDFKTEESYDETNKIAVKKVIEVTAWLANLHKRTTETDPTKKISEPDYTLIAKNDKLLGYLRMLVTKVNSNPAILNKGIVKTATQPIVDVNAFRGTTLAKMGLQPRIAVPGSAPSSMERLGSAIRSEQDAVRIRLMGPAIFGGLIGGSAAIDELEDRLSQETKQTWSVLKAQYLFLVQQLQGMKKDIAQADKEKIDKLFEELKRSETKLMQVMLMTEKYKDLLQVHGVQDNTPSLSIDHIKQFVDNRNKYFLRVAKKQNDLISIIRSIHDAVAKEAPVKNEVSTETRQESIALTGLLG
jgi:hypothetical protein